MNIVEVRPHGDEARFRIRWWKPQGTIVALSDADLATVRSDTSLRVRVLQTGELRAHWEALEKEAVALAEKHEAKAKEERQRAQEVRALASGLPAVNEGPKTQPVKEAMKAASPKAKG